MKEKIFANRNQILIVCIMALAIFCRFFYLGNIPGDEALHADEAYAGYQAWSLLNYGIDSDGYHNPVYFVAWGSGMNALESYCMIPFIALFGLTSLGIRFGSAVLGIVTVYVLYRLLKDNAGDEIALIGAGLIAIIPWHVMISRWGLESNFLPGFLLISVYFFMKALNNSKYAVVSMFFFGLGLYAYSATWVVMPLLLLALLVYFIKNGRLRIDAWWISGFVLLVVLAVPLLLFVAVNVDMIAPISSNFISIPKLTVFRGEDVSLSPRVMIDNIRAMMRVVVDQEDDWLWNCMPATGIYYRISGIFIAFGIGAAIYSVGVNRHRDLNVAMIIWFIAAVILGCLIEGNINRINIIHIPVIYFCVYGIYSFISFFKNEIGIYVKLCLGLIYLISFTYFFSYYCTKFDDNFATRFSDGISDAIDYAIRLDTPGEIHFSGIDYPEVLVYLKYPTDDFVDTVVWDDASASFRPLNSFGNKFAFYNFTDEAPVEGDIYIVDCNNAADAVNYLYANDMSVTSFENVVVGIK